MAKQKKLQKFQVGVFYQTPAGNAGSITRTVRAKNEIEATKQVEAIIRKKKNGKYYKIHGGDCWKVK
ncbi:MAG: hypothetical protein PHW73_00250 [Atribacterota bacterium]|nr:hypothetical protein [Atribacterota bacterium]